MLPKPRDATLEEVPVLDLSEAATFEGRRNLACILRKAAVDTGFFYIRNHGISAGQLEGVFDASRRYFALPLEARMGDLVDNVTRRGYSPMSASQQDGFHPDLKESYDFGYDLPADDPDVVAGLFGHGPNKWPDHFPDFQKRIAPYIDAVLGEAKTLFRLFAISLDAPEDYFTRHLNKPMMQTRLMHYPPQSSLTQDDVFGTAPHVDIGFITILAQDPIGGLELQKKDGEWVSAPHLDGTFVVNLGDLFKRVSNDIYSSTYHRVVNRSGRQRYSIPSFINLDYHTPVSCLESCIVPGDVAHYPPVTSGEVLESTLRHYEVALENGAY